MYAMPGMTTHLNLQADKAGSFKGVAANISGKGFAGMKFTLKALPPAEYNTWFTHAHAASKGLNNSTYAALSQPSENNKPAYYKSVDSNLYTTVVMKYMMPTTGDAADTHDMQMTEGPY